MAINTNVWTVGNIDNSLLECLKKLSGLGEFVLKILISKGYDTIEKINSYLDCNINHMSDPFLLADMDKATARIHRALENSEKIMIYGDYDVDGVTSVATLYRYLVFKGGFVEYYIPERLGEGYGLNQVAIESFKQKGIKLIITVDSGITAHEEIDYANLAGIDVVITDHHECRDVLPNALAVVNPHRKDSMYPFRELAGVGVVFRLVCALENNKNLSSLFLKYSDIVALGTVADVMPIISENRIIVKNGLKALSNTKNLGLSALVEQSFSERRNAKCKNLTATSIGYVIAPRINAAGRIGDVNKAVELLVTNDKGNANNIALYLCALNRERQLVENRIFQEAVDIIESNDSYLQDKVIVLSSKSWHLGVIGIVASKLTEKYKRPTVLISFDNNEAKGSARSVKGFNINDAISSCSDLLIKYGGHELAAGLTIQEKNIDAFKQRINDYARDNFDFDNQKTLIDANFEISLSDITVENANHIKSLEPFGLHNQVPLFCVRNVCLSEIYSIGEGKHLKLVLKKDNASINSVYFGKQRQDFCFSECDFVDVMGTIELNDFRGTLSVQFLIKDIKPAQVLNTEIEEYNKLYNQILSKKAACPSVHIPELKNFKIAFLFIKHKISTSNQKINFNIYHASTEISRDFNIQFSPLMLNICVDVFCEMGLVSLERYDENNVVIQLENTTAKVNLNESSLLKALKNNK